VQNNDILVTTGDDAEMQARLPMTFLAINGCLMGMVIDIGDIVLGPFWLVGKSVAIAIFATLLARIEEVHFSEVEHLCDGIFKVLLSEYSDPGVVFLCFTKFFVFEMRTLMAMSLREHSLGQPLTTITIQTGITHNG
jgi:hypothetical protein